MHILRVKIGLSIVLSFIISAVLIRFVSFEEKPVFQTEKMQEEAQALQASIKSTIAGAVPKFSFPPLSSIFTAYSTQQAPSPTASAPPPISSSQSSVSSPLGFVTQAPQPTFSAPVVLPTTPPRSSSSSISSSSSSQPFPTSIPSPEPTKKPKPTKTPKPTAVPKLKLEARRPGSSFEEVMNTISPIMCVPVPLMHATLENEYGPWLKNIEADWDNKNTMQGTDTTAVSGSQTIIGVTQMMSDTWYRIKNYVMAKFTVDDMSLNVTFDSIAASAYHQRNVSLAGQDHQPCDDWDVKYILYAACRYNGACPPNTMGQTQYYNDYTYKVCEAYNRYTTGPKKNCK